MEDYIVKLIQKVLDGEEEAFATLVRKYQKKAHAHAFYIIGDYQIAEDITQDAFIQVYKKLSTLKNPKLFDGWLYVIVNRLSLNWIQRKKPIEESLEDIPEQEIEEYCYLQYKMEQHNMETKEERREIVDRLLEKLPENERQILTLYYMGEMTAKEIANYLGVSTNTIKSKLRRARNRLRTENELLIDETLKGLQLSTDLTETIMRKIADIKPEPMIAKPVLPWAAIGTSVFLIILLLGGLNSYIKHLQRPYNFEALSEPTIEIVESPLTLNIISKPYLRNQVGKELNKSKNNVNGTQVSEGDLADGARENVPNFPISEWTETRTLTGRPIYNIFSTSDNNLYAMSSTGVYRLTKEVPTWTRISASVPTTTFLSPITQHQGNLYTLKESSIFASTDSGETWKEFCSRPHGQTIGLIITDKKQKQLTDTGFVMYIALRNKGVFRSDDAGQKWTPINNGLTDKRITTIAAIENTVFVGTNQGLYCLKSEKWDLLPIEVSSAVHSLAVFENNLYVATGPDVLSDESLEFKQTHSRKIFRSSDLGMMWAEITPKDHPFGKGVSPKRPTRIWINGNSLLVSDHPMYHSMDRGETWTKHEIGRRQNPFTNFLLSPIDENTIYRLDVNGIHRTTDRGITWKPFINGILGTKAQDIVAFNERLYAYTGSIIYELPNKGRGWKTVSLDTSKFIPNMMRSPYRDNRQILDAKLVIVDKSLYLIKPQGEELVIYRFNLGQDVFSMIQRIYTHERGIRIDSRGIEPPSDVERENSDFNVNNHALYIEYKNKLYRWKIDSLELTDTGLVDTMVQSKNKFNSDVKFAATTEIVYIGMRDGKLFQSLNRGKNWKDITLSVPVNFTLIKDLVMVDSTVFVATDRGVLSSQTGKHWRIITGDDGTQPIIHKLATDGLDLYGTGDMGIYRLATYSKWEQISPSVPDKVISMAVDNDQLYIVTDYRQIFHTVKML